jgi:hypothetical protein
MNLPSAHRTTKTVLGNFFGPLLLPWPSPLSSDDTPGCCFLHQGDRQGEVLKCKKGLEKTEISIEFVERSRRDGYVEGNRTGTSG